MAVDMLSRYRQRALQHLVMVASFSVQLVAIAKCLLPVLSLRFLSGTTFNLRPIALVREVVAVGLQQMPVQEIGANTSIR